MHLGHGANYHSASLGEQLPQNRRYSIKDIGRDRKRRKGCKDETAKDARNTNITVKDAKGAK